MIKQLKFMQPITRVHNLFRIRTIVNAVTYFNLKNKYPGDDEIAMVLAKKGLSKLRKEKIKDRIMRRARDHLLTASYLGLLSRKGRPFGYWSTTVGKMLKAYEDEECPKDAKEEAVFIDKIMRLKLTNVYDLQQRKQYEELRSRPCLYILYTLSKRRQLHEHQIALVNGAKRCDPLLYDKEAKRILREIKKYAKVDRKTLSKFYKDYGVDKAEMRNMTRNIRPLLDWCESLGLVVTKELPKVAGRWYSLTERGMQIFSIYGQKLPIWYSDLGKDSPAKAALLLFYKFLKLKNLTAGPKLLGFKLHTGLVEVPVKDLIQDLETKNNIKFATDYSSLDCDIDFTFEYDIPPNDASVVKSLLGEIGKIYKVKINEILSVIELYEIDELRFFLEKQHENIRQIETKAFASRTAVSATYLSKVSSAIPTLGILSQYKSDFEKEVALLLRILDFNANKYQGQMADRCSKRYAMRFFENNPDILITNGLEVLVECKSIGEWKPPLSDKNVAKEIVTYEQLFPEVRPDSILVAYEGPIDMKSLNIISSILDDAKHVVFVTKNYLINSLHKPALKTKLIKILKNPKKHRSSSRILR